MQFSITVKLLDHVWLDNTRHSSFKLPEALAYAAKQVDDVQAFQVFDDNGACSYQITAKSHWKENIQRIESFLKGSFEKHITSLEYFDVCWMHGCFEPAAATLSSVLKAVMLYDRHGEQPHILHEKCKFHCSPTDTSILKSLQVLTLTEPEEKYWSKVISWQARKFFYSQRAELDWETTGDYGEGYYYQMASPFYGPFQTREEAVEAAKGHEW